MRTADFEFYLPPELVAQHPLQERDKSRLFVLERQSGQVTHRAFKDLKGYLKPGDILVLNNSRVIRARLRGVNAKTGGAFEVLLLNPNGINDWWVMLRPGKRARNGTRIIFHDARGQPGNLEATVVETNAEGHRRLHFSGTADVLKSLDNYGEVPLPPYIERSGKRNLRDDIEQYQTVFAAPPGSIAAPTAGLHFTTHMLEDLRSHGVVICFLTLHVGLGTFAPVKTETIEAHCMHEERYELSEQTVSEIAAARARGGKVFAVGTTTVRVLESVARENHGHLKPGAGRTRIFIYPPFDFRIVDAMLTNFHLPRSTLVMLVSAFAAPNSTCGRNMVLSAYAEAIREKYRFFSYGDAMLLL